MGLISIIAGIISSDNEDLIQIKTADPIDIEGNTTLDIEVFKSGNGLDVDTLPYPEEPDSTHTVELNINTGEGKEL